MQRDLITYRFLSILLAVVILTTQSCEDFVDVDSPSNKQTSEAVFEDETTANAVLIGLYASIAQATPTSAQTFNSIFLVGGVSADELTVHGGAANANTKLVSYFLNQLNAGSSVSSETTIWSDVYTKLYRINLAIENLENSDLDSQVKQQLTGEAKFLRALMYFYLVNLYGDVPLTTSSDYRVNSSLERAPAEDVYNQIVKDLKDAKALMADYYVAADGKSNSTERLRPNKWTATALLSRVYLYTGEWANAEAEAGSIISNVAQYDTVSLNGAFLKNNKEAIWQLQPVNVGWNTEDARIFILPASGPTITTTLGYPVYLSNQLLSAFEAGDKRKDNWTNTVTVGSGASSVTYHYAFKYKSGTLNSPVTEYTTVFRMGEQYLIRAEARARQNNISDAKADLNVIRKRAGLAASTANDQTALLNAIYHERQVELFTEWGHRWLDVKRLGIVDEVMPAVATAKGSSWNKDWQWYPIPLYDIVQNPNLEQNNGY